MPTMTLTDDEREILAPDELQFLKAPYDFINPCRLKECETLIFTNRKKHYYCTDDHRDEYWRRRRSKSIRLESRVKDLEKRVSDLENK